MFMLDQKGKALMPCTEKRASSSMIPFVIRLVDRTLESCALQPLRTKIDLGKCTGRRKLPAHKTGQVWVSQRVLDAHQARQGIRHRRHGAS